MQRHLDAFDDVDDVARWQQCAARRAGRVLEVEPDRGRGAGHAGDGAIAVVHGHAVTHRERRGGDSTGVQHANAHDGLGALGGHEAPFDGEGADTGEEVAAVLLIGDERFVHTDLEEEVVDVGGVVARRAHDGDLRRERMGATDAVDLARVGAPHDTQQQVVALRGVDGKLVGEEVGALRRATPHDHAAHSGHFAASDRSRRSSTCIVGRHCATLALGSRPSATAAKNSRSCNSMPSFETATPLRSTGFS